MQAQDTALSEAAEAILVALADEYLHGRNGVFINELARLVARPEKACWDISLELQRRELLSVFDAGPGRSLSNRAALTDLGHRTVSDMRVPPAKGRIPEFADGLDEVRRLIVDVVAEQELRSAASWPTRSHIRTVVCNAIAPRPDPQHVNQLLDDLEGAFLQAAFGHEKSHRLRLRALLASRWGINALETIDGTLRLLRRLKNSEPSTFRYSSTMLREALGLPSKWLNLARVAIREAKLGDGPHSTEGDYWWGTPPDLDLLLQTRSALDYVNQVTASDADFANKRRPGSAAADDAPSALKAPQPCSRMALLLLEHDIAEAIQGRLPPRVVGQLLREFSNQLPPGETERGRTFARSLLERTESEAQRVLPIVPEWIRKLHRTLKFAASDTVDESSYVSFLRAALQVDRTLGVGQAIPIPRVVAKARLSDETGRRAAARALDEGLAYVSDVDAQAYAIQLHQEEVQDELERLEHSLSVAQASKTERSGVPAPVVDIGIITIRKDEFEAVLNVFPEPNDKNLFISVKTGRHYNLRLADAGAGDYYRIAIARQVHPGTGEGQALARDLIEDLAPALILVVGIAGAPPSDDLTLGDVFLAVRVHDFTLHANTPDGQTEYAIGGGPVAGAIAAGVVNLAARTGDLGTWWDGLPDRPSVAFDDPGKYTGDSDEWKSRVRSSLERHFRDKQRIAPTFTDGVLGSSDGLIKDPAVVIELLRTARNLGAFEMEAAGVYRAAHGRTAMLAIRGISDIVGFERDPQSTAYACHSAAAFTRAYLRTRPVAVASKRETTIRAAVEHSAGPGAMVAELSAGGQDVELLMQQLERFEKLAVENNIAAYHRSLAVNDVHYDSRLLDTAIGRLAPALSHHPFLLDRLQDLQEAIQKANGHAARWPRTQQPSPSIFNAVSADAIAIRNSAGIAREKLKKILGKP